MIKVFKATDKTYASNGDLVLNSSKATIHKEDNGAYYLDLEAPLFNKSNTKTKLPSTYTQVEYIQSSGTQYIDTGMKATQNTAVKIVIEGLTNASNKILGSRSSATSNNFSILTGQVSGNLSIVTDFQNYQNNNKNE